MTDPNRDFAAEVLQIQQNANDNYAASENRLHACEEECARLRVQLAKDDDALGVATELWIVFQYRDEKHIEFQGVFSDKEKAIAACKTWTYSVNGPVILNQELPAEPMQLEKCWYPLTEAEPGGSHGDTQR